VIYQKQCHFITKYQRPIIPKAVSPIHLHQNNKSLTVLSSLVRNWVMWLYRLQNAYNYVNTPLTIFSRCGPASYFMNCKINIAKLCLLTAVIWSHQVQITASYTTEVNFCGSLNLTSNNSSTNTE